VAGAPSESIRRKLVDFVERWRGWEGSEREAAQPFLVELLDCYDTAWKEAGIRFEFRLPSGIADMIWSGNCLVEMKGPRERYRLETHYTQALRYWHESGAEDRDPPKFILLSSFNRFLVYQPGRPQPLADFSIEQLPDRREALAFLAGDEPEFFEDRAELTREAVTEVTELFTHLHARRAERDDVLRDFVLQCVWCMFAEDSELIPRRIFTRLLDGLLEDQRRSTADDLGGLFDVLAAPGPRPKHGVYGGAPFVDGALFERPAHVHLEPDEVGQLREAARFDWHRVEPAIFGFLLEGALGRERQWRFGAHYTSERDILEVVRPTVVEPWSERIELCRTPEDVEVAKRDFASFRVLDPACGSGNFLYVAYRELKELEASLRATDERFRRERGLPSSKWESLFTLQNLFGIDNEPFAIKLARVTLWMGYAQVVERLSLAEPALPLPQLPGIVLADALKMDWPQAEAIVGNPPYHGSQQIRSELGDDYAEWLKREFGVGLKDYAVYWFRKAHDALPDGGRAGLVATNSVSQGRGRSASLDYIVGNGGVITNAISRRPWPGVAMVNVSIVNWVKNPSEPPAIRILNGAEVSEITPALRSRGTDVSEASRLPQNRGRCFQGPIPADQGGFILSDDEAHELLARADANYRDVVRPYLTSDDIAASPTQASTRWIIDFAMRSLEEAMVYPVALDIARQRVKPFRARNRRKLYRERWWIFAEPRPGMRRAVAPLPRYVAGTRHGVRLHFCWCDPWTLASDATNTFAFADDYALGVLSAGSHVAWAWAQSSTVRTDLRYTPTSAFETFPWPQPTDNRRETIAELSRAVIARRQEICAEREIGLTKLYNQVDDGAYRDLRDLHRKLDEAVAAAYRWPKSAAHDPAESNRRLLELNRTIAAGEVGYRPFD
jgi:hypothetical protein